VIGGGMAGLHCAMRLAEVGVDVTIYEASDRTGGRIFTARGMFSGELVGELGGEFIDTGHLTMQELAEEFGIALDDRTTALPKGTTVDTWWIAGVAVPEETVVEQFTEVAPLMLELVEMADSDDEAYAMLDVIPLSDWLDDNVPPAMFPELHAILTAAYRGEYGRETSEQSVLNMLYLIGSDDPDPFRIFGISDERFHTHLGNDTITTALADALEGRIQTGMALVAARDAGEAFTLAFMGPDGEVEVEADHVVFALPFTRLRQVDLEMLTLTEDKRAVIAELQYGTNAKVMGEFTERVWTTQHMASGSVTTDEDFQQTWDTSIGQDGDAGLLTNFLGGEQGLAAGDGEAEAWFTDVCVAGVEAVFPGAEAAYVAGSAVRMHWPTHPQTLGSYACYLPGQWAFYGLEGAREGNVHFCGEHCSLEFQGYMEGAAETGALTAAAILEDLGIAMSQRHRAIVERKLVLPHPAIHGRLPERPRWLARQRALR
jgi:monoamine oxidase